MTSTLHKRTTLQSLASEMSRAFDTVYRPDGTAFRKLRDGAPDWMVTVCRKAQDNGKAFLDSWRYAFIAQAVDALADYGDADRARCSLEPDLYTCDLTAWLRSLNSRAGYLGAAIEKYHPIEGGFRLVAAAQMIEKEEVFQMVATALGEELGRSGN